ncbi:MAG: DUF3048 domain-containing protein [Oscillospiraceae bacterium]|nr:DUF3048 domain-containing protein [Oscillospiraceae bacterium]
MLKKLAVILLSLTFLTLTACGNTTTEKPALSSSGTESTPAPEPKPTYYMNSLTGEVDLSLEVSKRQPVAVMVNNINFAQKIQTGLENADIVYETEVEGGITRLMAVYQDIKSAGKIGSIRSARYVYVDLALGHNAVYIHHGQDSRYCGPHLKDIEHYTAGTNNCAKRIQNGLAYEHTLYAEGKSIYSCFMKNKKLKERPAWQNFADPEESITLSGGTCTKLAVPFSDSYKTGFNYDANSGKYTRLFNGTVLKDYVSGNPTQFKNIFVLLTNISNYSDGYHRNVSLKGGNGYYIVNGTYTPIKWSKSSSTAPIKFTNTDGTSLTVNTGSSWVCIARKDINVTFE